VYTADCATLPTRAVYSALPLKTIDLGFVPLFFSISSCLTLWSRQQGRYYRPLTRRELTLFLVGLEKKKVQSHKYRYVEYFSTFSLPFLSLNISLLWPWLRSRIVYLKRDLVRISDPEPMNPYLFYLLGSGSDPYYFIWLQKKFWKRYYNWCYCSVTFLATFVFCGHRNGQVGFGSWSVINSVPDPEDIFMDPEPLVCICACGGCGTIENHK
jgi:hypothetical protein